MIPNRTFPGTIGPLDSARLVLASAWRRFPERTAGVIVLTTLAGLLDGIGVAMIFPVLSTIGLGSGEAGTPGHFFARIVEWVGGTPSPETIIGTFGATIFLYNALAIFQARYAAQLSRRYTVALMREAWQLVLASKWPFFVQRRGTDITGTIQNIEQAAKSLIYFTQILSTSVVTALYLAVAFVSNWRLSLAFILFGAMSFALLRGLLSRAHQIGTEFNRSSLARAAKATEAVINMKLVKALGAERRIADEIAGLVESVSKFNARLETYPSAVRAIFEVVAVGLVCASLLAAVGGLVADVGTVLGVLFVFVRTYPRLSTIQQYFQSAAASLAFVPGIFRLMEDARRNREIEPASGNGRPAAETGRDVELRGVTVSYGDANAVENLDLSVATGEYVVIVGDSGSGKTTVLDCVLSLVQPTGGDVVVLGRSTSNTAPGVLRAQIGYIGQDTFLFNMSVRKNIAFPRDDVPDAMLENALSMAAASEFVAGLENGAETEIGDAGVRLSGGQRQRIGIARFFCDRKRLLLLDEATSALDVNTEDRILASLRALKGKSTIVFVTHRLSAARDADRVVVMDRGRIVEQGDWQSLTAAGGRFSAMWRRHADPVVAGP